MKRFFHTARAGLAGLALAGAMTHEAAAQFVAASNYGQQPYQVAQPAYGQQQAPAYYQQQAQQHQPVQQQAPLAPPTYGYPRVAQAGELPAPAEAVNAAATNAAAPAMAVPAANAAPQATYMAPTAAAMPYNGGYQQATSHVSAPISSAPISSGCATGNCGAAPMATHAPAMAAPVANYSYAPSADCGYAAPVSACSAAPACDLGIAAGPSRQWFVGAYGLFLNRAGDVGKSTVAYMTDTAGFTAGNNYYYLPSDPKLITTDAGQDGQFGAEIRFGSTFGPNTCGCGNGFAWEVGYWGLDADSSTAAFTLPGIVSSANTQRLYTMGSGFNGLMLDRDGAGAAVNRPIYQDHGNPADGDIYATDVRILGVRVRQRFEAQNLELNFWRFGAPTAVSGCGGGGCVASSPCGVGACGTGACGGGAGAGCGYGAPAVGGGLGGLRGLGAGAAPRRFFINGLAGVRFLRIDDDFGFDTQFTIVDVPPSGTAGDPPTGWPDQYTSFPTDDNSVYFSDFDANNELVGFQLGCSMNWLVGCKWNLFADTNFGIYGNDVSVTKRVYGGGASEVTYANGGGVAVARGSEQNVAFVGELRAGVGYQVSCNCRLTAAYRFFGVGGVALGGEEFRTTDWSNPTSASHIDTNRSLILHGLQTGVEYKF